MSLELHFLPYHQGRVGAVARADLRSLFPIVEAESEPDYWQVRYDTVNSCTIGLTPVPNSPDFVESFCVYRPCATPRFWDDVLAVLQLGPVALVFPGNSPPLVGSDATTAHLPSDVIASMGAPLVVRSAAAIAQAVADA